MPKASTDNLLVDKPTDTSATSDTFSTRFRSSGWFEIFLPHTGDPEGTIAIKGGVNKLQTTHSGLEVLSSQIYVNGANLSDTPVTGLTLTAAGTLTVASTLDADVYIRIPVINVPPWISAVYTRTGGGSSSQLLQVSFHGREAS